MNRTATLSLLVISLLSFVSTETLALAEHSITNPIGTTASTIKIIGKILDADTKQPVEYATVAIFNQQDSTMIGGGLVPADGTFSSEIKANADLKIKIDFIGYKPIVLSNLKPNKNTIDFGTILLKKTATTLNAVEVSAEKNQMQIGIDKKVFAVSKDLTTSTGGTAQDVLQNVPSVSVDQNGTINLRGSSNVRILVNGKPSNITGSTKADILKQIPASSIENIEVITNPSAKYDAEGMAGIINIVLKKQRAPGLNGLANITVGNRDKYTSSINLNYNVGKFNFFGGYDNRFTLYGDGGHFKRYSNFNNNPFYFKQTDDIDTKSKYHNFRTGFDYNINDKNTITLSSAFRIGENKTRFDIIYDSLNAAEVLQKSYNSNTRSLDKDNGADYTFSYKRSFDKKDRSLSADILYSQGDATSNNNMQQNYVNPPTLQHTTSFDHQKSLILQSDYIEPLGEGKGKIETGYKSSFRSIKDGLSFTNFDYTQNAEVIDPLRTNDFNYNEQIHAGYIQYSNKYKKFSYQGGLRMEETFITSELVKTNQLYNQHYRRFFPSLFLSQELNAGQQLQLNYSRRINRPSFFLLNPFPDYSDLRNVRIGDPFLKPEMVNSYELSYIKYTQKGTYTTTLFYRHTDNAFRRMYKLQENGIGYLRFLNVATADNYGIEAIVNQKIASFISLTGSVNYYKAFNTGFGIPTVRSSLAIAKLMTAFTLPHKLSLQVSGNYRSPFDVIGGRIQEMMWCDIGLKKDVMNGKGYFTLRLSDVFNSQYFKVNNFGNDYATFSSFKGETRVLYFGFTYLLNNFKPKQTKGVDNGGKGGNMTY